MTKIIVTALLFTAMAACSRAPGDFDKQSQKYWEQAAAANELISSRA